jgi:hypothetical protein
MKVDFTSAALRYAGLGWKVFPLAAGSKVPAIKNGHGVKDASAYADQIRAWGLLYPNANIGIACGLPSGIIVIDVDPRNGGDATLAKLAAKGHVLPPGPRAHTGNGGWHYVFRFDPKVTNSKNRVGPGVDIKSSGGYVVAAPSWIRASRDGSGGVYRWEVSPLEVAVPRLPLWMTTVLAPSPRPSPKFEHDDRGGDIEPLARFVATAPKGERNNRLHWASCRAGEMIAKRKASESACVTRLMAAAAASGLKGPEAIRTIQSGLQSGAGQPRGGQ